MGYIFYVKFFLKIKCIAREFLSLSWSSVDNFSFFSFKWHQHFYFTTIHLTLFVCDKTVRTNIWSIMKPTDNAAACDCLKHIFFFTKMMRKSMKNAMKSYKKNVIINFTKKKQSYAASNSKSSTRTQLDCSVSGSNNFDTANEPGPLWKELNCVFFSEFATNNWLRILTIVDAETM